MLRPITAPLVVQVPPLKAPVPVVEAFVPGDAYEGPDVLPEPLPAYPRAMVLAEVVHHLILRPDVGRLFTDARGNYSKAAIERYQWILLDSDSVIKIPLVWDDDDE